MFRNYPTMIRNGYGWTWQESRPNFYNSKVYSLLTNGSKPTPSYLNFESYVQPDNKNIQIPVVDIQSEFSGEGGHYSEIYVKATPIDAPNKSITLPLKEYQNRVAKRITIIIRTKFIYFSVKRYKKDYYYGVLIYV